MQGTTILFTGLSGAGKTTIAKLVEKFFKFTGATITMLDGDELRKNFSANVGFTKQDRDAHLKRLGWVAAEINKHGGVVICAVIAPYDEVRKVVRSMVEQHGTFVLVHVSTPLEECEKRDVKGLYARARRGEIENFTGISDPYEIPEDAELTIDTTLETPKESAMRVLEYLERS
jgi:sulfate adenylyltransferase